MKKKLNIKLIVASSPQDKQQGLMHVPSLDKDIGILFVGINDGDRFHTQNCHFPIDFLCLSDTGKVLYLTTLQPDISGIRVEDGTRYVIEANAGTFSLKPGDIIDLGTLDILKTTVQDLPRTSVRRSQRRELTEDEKELFKAVRRNDIGRVKELLDKGIDVNIRSNSGWAPLHEAVFQGYVGMVKLLLDYGVSLNTRSEHGWTPLYTAVYRERSDMVKLLLEHGADPNVQAVGGWTPLHEAVHSNCIGIARLLLEHGADPNIQSEDKWTPLHYAVLWGYKYTIKLLLDHGADPEIRNDEGKTPKDIAQEKGYVEIVKLLDEYSYPWDELPRLSIKQGQRELTRDEMFLFEQAVWGSVDEVKKPLDRGVNPNIRDKDGDTPLHRAAFHDRVEIVKTLLDYGADPEIRNNEGKTPRDLAQEEGCTEVIKLLDEYTYPWENMPKLSIRQAQGQELTEDERELFTILEYYGREDYYNLDAIIDLLDKGVNVNVQDEDGITPLILACDALDGSDLLEVIKLLLDYGADPNIQDNDGWVPLHLVVMGGEREAVKLLLEHGANPNIENKEGKTPRDIAQEKGYDDIVKLLDKYGCPWDALPRLSIRQAQAGREFYDEPSDIEKLFNAIHNNDAVTVNRLLDEGLSPDVKDSDGDTPLIYAAEDGQFDMVKLLLNRGAKPNKRGADRETALHHAAYNSYVDIVELLLDYGADPNIQDRYGVTPLHDAAEDGRIKIIKLLLEHGANPEIKDDEGKTPKDIAQQYGHTGVVELLDGYIYPWDQLPELS